MTRTAVRGLATGALAVVGLGVVAMLLSPGSPARTLEIYLFVVAVLALSAILLVVAGVLPRAEPTPFEQPPRAQRVGQLDSVARALDLAEASAFDLHTVFRPIVREVAAAQLARHGVSLDRQPERARALLGAQTWELVCADREAPARGAGRGGCSRTELHAIVGSLEAL